MKNLLKHLKIVMILIALQFLLDMLYVYLYSTVNPIRATLIGLSALAILFAIYWIPPIYKFIELKPYIAFLPIYSSALFGALLVQAEAVKSKSPESGIAHVVILIVTYFVVVFIGKFYNKTH